MKEVLFYIILLFCIYSPGLLYSQAKDLTYTNGFSPILNSKRIDSLKKMTKDLTYPNGFSPILNSKRIKHLKNMMGVEKPNWDSVKKYYFGAIYDPELVDLICYIKKDSVKKDSVKKGSIKIGLVNDHKVVTELFGKRNMWVLIFSEYNLNDAKCSKDLAKVNLEVLNYEREPSQNTIFGVLKAISSVIFGKSIETMEQEKTLQDSTATIKFKKNVDCGDSLFVYMHKFKLGLNTKNRVVIEPPENSQKQNFQFINYNFGNFEASYFGVSLGVGSTITHDLTDSSKINLYVFGHFFLCRPRLPVNNLSSSVVLGSNFITGKFLRDVILGLRIGYNPAGIIGGVDWVLLPNKGRKPRGFIGLDFRLQ